MLNLIIDTLKKSKDISGYLIKERLVESGELFFVKKNLDMNRGKRVHHYNVTVYVNYEEEDKKYTGSSSTKIHPTMDAQEVEQTIHQAMMAAKYVKNQYYPLVEPSNRYLRQEPSQFSKENIADWMNKITKALYKNDVFDKGGINSCEIFLDKVYTHVVNSNGVDVEEENYTGMVEFITTWKEDGEEVELYRCLNFSDFDETSIEDAVDEMITICKEKAIAQEVPALNDATIMLTREAVMTLLRYYYNKSKASSIYNQISNWSIGQNIQGDEVTGDKITIVLDPMMKNSTSSLGFDEDGFPVEKITMIENGELKNYIADMKYGFYLNVKPTGNILNMAVEGGSKSIEELRNNAQLEIAAFSDFYVDGVTGDFGGEIRLAWYYDGEKRYPVTGGSIAGNILEVHHDMYLSKEMQKDNNFEGPMAVQIHNINVTGI